MINAINELRHGVVEPVELCILHLQQLSVVRTDYKACSYPYQSLLDLNIILMTALHAGREGMGHSQIQEVKV